MPRRPNSIDRRSHGNARAIAARLLDEVVFAARSLDAVLEVLGDGVRDRALIREFVTGGVRFWYSLDAEVEHRLHRPLRAKDHLLRCLLVIGAHQLRHLRVPAYAAVNETVEAAAQLGLTSAKGLVNQVLRALPVAAPAPFTEEARFDHPQWLIDRIRDAHPDDWQAVLEENNRRAPMALRVNPRRTDRQSYQTLLASLGIASYTGLAANALLLDAPMRVSELPHHDEGWVSVQDEGAQLATEVLTAGTGERVLDACAAPGGKALAILERAEVDLLALEIDRHRSEVTRAEFKRLGFAVDAVHTADATQLDWWDGRSFDRILLDAPCSGTGTLRRHPDIKLLKRESDLEAYRRTQTALLANLWKTLRAGGSLLYCTCSILDDENDRVIADFLAMTGGIRTVTIERAWGRATRHGSLILPRSGGPDGFYFSLLEKS